MTVNIPWPYKLIKVWYLGQSYESWNPLGLPFFEKHAALPFSTLKLLLLKKKIRCCTFKWDFWLEAFAFLTYKSKPGWISGQSDCYRAHQVPVSVVPVAIYERSVGLLPLNLLSLCCSCFGWQVQKFVSLDKSFHYLPRLLGWQVPLQYPLLTVKCLPPTPSEVSGGPPCCSLGCFQVNVSNT